jgi:hypothetical protein
LSTWAIWSGASVLARWWQKGQDEVWQRAAREAHGHYVVPADLTDDAAELLALAQQAVRTILGSDCRAHDLVDGVRDAVVLPQAEWEIATGLAEYSRLIREHDGAEGAAVLRLVDQRHAALEASLSGLARRVKALQSYANAVEEADARLREFRNVQHLTDKGDEVLALLARTAGDDLAIGEITGMTEQVDLMRDALTAALDSVQNKGATIRRTA